MKLCRMTLRSVVSMFDFQFCNINKYTCSGYAATHAMHIPSTLCHPLAARIGKRGLHGTNTSRAGNHVFAC